jgi:hypothetical protein
VPCFWNNPIYFPPPTVFGAPRHLSWFVIGHLRQHGLHSGFAEYFRLDSVHRASLYGQESASNFWSSAKVHRLYPKISFSFAYTVYTTCLDVLMGYWYCVCTVVCLSGKHEMWITPISAYWLSQRISLFFETITIWSWSDKGEREGFDGIIALALLSTLLSVFAESLSWQHFQWAWLEFPECCRSLFLFLFVQYAVSNMCAN